MKGSTVKAGNKPHTNLIWRLQDKSSKMVSNHKEQLKDTQSNQMQNIKTVIMRGGEYNCRAVKMHLKLRDQQFKIITYTYT